MPIPLPLAAWGSVEDISASPWSNLLGTPSVASVTDPFGGTQAYKITDANGAANEARSRSVGALFGTIAEIVVCVKADTAAGFRIYLSDTDAANASKIGLEGSVSGGVPSIASASFGTAVNPVGVSLGNGFYLFIGRGTIVSGHNHRLELYATAAGAGNTGATIFFIRSMALFEVQNLTAWSDPRPGSSKKRSGAGVGTSWIKGWDYLLRGQLISVPTNSRNSPEVASGFEGGGESPGVNCGVDALLQAGRSSKTIRWVRDRSSCTVYNDGELLEPFTGGVSPDDAGERTIDGFTLVSSTPYYGY